MQDDDRGGKKDGERRLDKAVLLNLLSKVDSCGRSTDGPPLAPESIVHALGAPALPGDPHEPQVPGTK